MTYCKVGFLAGVGGNRQGIGDYIRRLNAAGRPAVVMAYDDAGLIAEAQAIGALHNVANVLAFRPSTIYGDENPGYMLPPEAAANAYYDRWITGIPAEIDRARVWCIAFNEGRKEADHGNWWGYVGLHFARRANAAGLRVALYGWSAGTPEPEGYDTPGYEALLRYIDANHGRVAIAVHEGANPAEFAAPAGSIPLINNVPYITARYRALFERCDRLRVKRPAILITECAWRYDSAPAVSVGMPQVVEAAEFYAQEREVLGVALWWLGPGHNGVANTLQPYIAPLTAYALTASFPEPQPPEPPDPQEPTMPDVTHPTSVPAWAGAWNPYTYALSRRIYADGWRPASEEWDANGWLYHAAMNEAGDRRIYGVPIGEWDAVTVVHPAAPERDIIDVVDTLPKHASRRYGTRAASTIQRVTIHHTASDPSVGPTTVAAYHVNVLQWPGIAYHYMIDTEGTIRHCQRISAISYHDTENVTSIGIALQGRFMDGAQPTDAQIAAARWLIAQLEADLGRSLAVRGHKEVLTAATACPGDTWHIWRNRLGRPAAATVDLWEFMTGGVTGWGAAYMVEALDANGNRAGMERYQNYVTGNRLFITKGDLVEVYELRGDTIWQIIDTSPGNMDAGEPTYYTVAGGSGYAPRWLTTGMQWEERDPHVVTFRRVRDCVNYGSRYSGAAVNRILNVTLDGDTLYVTGQSETQIWQRGNGRVGWLSEWGSARLSTDDPGNYLNLIVLPPCSGVTV